MTTNNPDQQFRAEFTDGSPAGAPTWETNGRRFELIGDAEAYALDLFDRWSSCRAARVVRDDVALRELVDTSDPRIVT